MADDYQLSFGGLVTVGDGTTYDVVSWGGFEEFATRNTDVTIPAGWGALGGSSFVHPRVVTLAIESVDPYAMIALQAALTPAPLSEPTTLTEIRWKFPEREEMVAYGRISRRSRPRNVTTALGLTRLTVELEFPDPRCYAYASLVAVAPVFFPGTTSLDLTADSGANLGFNITVDSGADLGFDFGGISASGQIVCTNAGEVETFPLITFSTTGGPCNQYTLTNVTTGQVLTVGGTLEIGDVLTFDMRPANAGTTAIVPVLLNGAARYSYWQPPRTPFALAPGDNVLQLDVQSGSGTLTAQVTWQSAYL